MACGNCGTGTGGKPAGCQSNGGCSTGCNKMNVFDWLAGLPMPEGNKPYDVVEVSFNAGSRKEFFRNAPYQHLEKGQLIAVEGTNGFDVGQVSLQGELVKLQLKKYSVEDVPEMKKILRPATAEDMATAHLQKGREQEVLVRSRAMARSLDIPMKIAQVELQADGRRGIFYYTADQRVDFRELIRQYATDFHLRVEMRQIGARQESGKVGGIGSCGRELCCATWLTDFKSVNTAAARYQNLAINQTKLSGQCGRLKCCLNYELDTYMDALKAFPTDTDHIETAQGRATLQKRDIFRNLMWYSFQGSNKQYPMTIARVMEIAQLNKDGVLPDELQALEVESVVRPKANAKVDMGFVNDVGQVSLKALERNRKSTKGRDGNATNRNQKTQTRQPGQPGDRPAGPRNESRNPKNQNGDTTGAPTNKPHTPRPPRSPRPGGNDATRNQQNRPDNAGGATGSNLRRTPRPPRPDANNGGSAGAPNPGSE